MKSKENKISLKISRQGSLYFKEDVRKTKTRRKIGLKQSPTKIEVERKQDSSKNTIKTLRRR